MRNGAEANRPIVDLTFAYALRIIRLDRVLEGDSAGRILGVQLLRSGTPIGANGHEAQGAQSRADFIARTSVAEKEAHEPLYWLRLVKEAGLVPSERLDDMLNETEELVRIVASIIVSTKRNIKH